MADPREGETWTDEKGPVRVAWISTDAFPYGLPGTLTRVGYHRNGQHHMLALRRFLRDFTRSERLLIHRSLKGGAE